MANKLGLDPPTAGRLIKLGSWAAFSTLLVVSGRAGTSPASGVSNEQLATLAVVWMILDLGRFLGASANGVPAPPARFLRRLAGLYWAHDVALTLGIATAVIGGEMLLRQTDWGNAPVLSGRSPGDVVEFVALAILIVWLAWRYWYSLPKFCRFCTRCPGLTIILTLMYAIVYGQFGTGFGVHYQFWHDGVSTRLSASCALTLLLGLLGILAYYLDPHPMWTAALVDDYFGGPDDRLLPGAPPPPFWRLRTPNTIRLSRFLLHCRWAFLVPLAVPALLPAVFSSIPRTPPVFDPDDAYLRDVHPRNVLTDPSARFAAASVWILGIALGLILIKAFCWIGERSRLTIAAFMRSKESRADVDGGRPPTASGRSGLWCLLKAAAGLRSLVSRIVSRLGGSSGHRPSAFQPAARATCRYHRGAGPLSCPIVACPAAAAIDPDAPLEGCAEFQDSRFAIFVFYFVFLAYFLALNIPWIYDRVLSAAFSICTLLGLLAMTYAWFARFFVRWRTPLIAAVMAWAVYVNLDPFSSRFERMESYYERRPKVDLRTKVAGLRTLSSDASLPSEKIGLVPDEEARTNWLREVRKGGDGDPLAPGLKPKLAVVAVSGGAARAAYWAGVVLERLEDELGKEQIDFGRHVRLITGSSGGMLGVSHYLLHRLEAASRRPKLVLKGDDAEPIPVLGAKWVDAIPRDSLSPVSKYMVVTEPWKLFVPRSWYGDDRGIRLERDWKNLRFPLRALAEMEKAGEIPSVIYSPMTIEDGRQLLISNLDLRIFAPWWSGEAHARQVGMSKGSALISEHPGDLRVDYSLSGVEFFRLFPDARGLLVSTAVRMGGTFPFISPAVNLPCQPPRRVVDAGYYDNYGVQTAQAWIFANREWLVENTSGVVLVQVRDSTSMVDRVGVDDSPETTWEEIGRGFNFFTSPLEGVARARFTSGLFRNDQAVQNLSEIFTSAMRARKKSDVAARRFFTTIILENAAEVSGPAHRVWPGLEFMGDGAGQGESKSVGQRGGTDQAAGVSMTWYLTRAERDALDHSIPDAPSVGEPLDRDWRRRHFRRLWEIVSVMQADDPRRLHAMNDYQSVGNYEKIQELKEWWKLGPDDPAAPTPAGAIPPQ